MIKKPGKSSHGKLEFYQFVLPALLFYALFFLIPLVGSIFYSFTDWDGISRNIGFAGIKNYMVVFTSDRQFIATLGSTALFAIISVFLINISALLLALLLDTNLRLRNVFRGIIFLPNSFSLIIVAFIMQFMFTKVYDGLVLFLQAEWLDVSWFGGKTAAMLAVTIALLWQSVGYYMVLYIAGLQTIDSSIIEAASIDGATGWKRFRSITFPLIMPSVTICLFLTIVNSFKQFELFFQMTGGGPGGATEVISLNIYKEAFVRNNLGYASAKAVILSLIILIVTMVQLRVFKGREVEM